MHRSEHRGLPVFWAEGPAPLTGGLLFGVGPQDETFRTRQVTHVIEHLVMTTLAKSHLDSNASVGPGTTLFHATGRSEQVVDFLNTVARALHDLPVARLSQEVGVLEAEEGLSVHPALAWAANMRYGNEGIGLLGDQGPPLDQLRPQDVRAHAARHFVSGNAALVFTGPPPEGLDVRVPGGPRPWRGPSIRSPLPEPGWVRDEMPWPVLSFLMPPTDVPWLLPALLSERAVADLRHRQGISYSVDGDHTLVNGQLLVALMPDGRPDHETQVTEALWRALTTLAQSGPSHAELQDVVDGAREEMQDPRVTFDQVLEAAARHLCQDPPLTVAEQVAQAEQVSATQVQDLAQQVLGTILLGVPTAAQPDLGGLLDLTEHAPPSGASFTGETFRRKRLSLAPRDLRAVVGDQGVSLTALSHTWSGPWQDVVGVAATAGDRVVVLRDGMDFQLCDKHLRDARRLFTLIDERAGDKVFSVAEDTFH